MKAIGRVAVILALGLAWTLPAQAGGVFVQGKELVEGWRENTRRENGNKPDYTKLSWYVGYITGIADALDTVAFDIPNGTTVDQTTAIVGKYLSDHPEEWGKDARELVLEAIRGAFPKKSDK